jgi:thioredoxin-related protein
MKKKTCLLVMCLPLLIMAQSDTNETGIKWAKGQTWELIKQKAKAEDKYIFLDAYATWCGPCKEMDKYIYPDDSIGKYFNERFISVKIQMDKTKKDDDNIRSWYKDAEIINNEYKVLSYPTYLFLSPQGVLVHKETGYKAVKDFLVVAQIALRPGKKYVDPFEKYNQLLTEYNEGKKDYAVMLYMIDASQKLRDGHWLNFANDYLSYLQGLSTEEICTKVNIEFLSNKVTLSSKSKLFSLFYIEGSKVDHVMNIKGYAQAIVDKIILREDIEPFIQVKAGGMGVMYTDPKAIPPIPPEPNWKQLKGIIGKKYNTAYTKRNLLNAKVLWHDKHHSPSFTKYYLTRLKRYGFDLSNEERAALDFNFQAWEIFEKSTNKNDLKTTIKWMKYVIDKYPFAGYIDTYANLLYKTGQRSEAIKCERRALALAIEKQDKSDMELFQKILNKMEKGEPTWRVK